MIAGDFRSRVDAMWDTFWTGGISKSSSRSPTCSSCTDWTTCRRWREQGGTDQEAIERRIFPEGKDKPGREGRAYDNFRCPRFKNLAPAHIDAQAGGFCHD